MSARFDGLAVVVVNYGASALLADGLVATARDLPGADVVVVDNLSTRGERDAVGALAALHGWHLVAADENLGFGAGCNVGAAAAWARGATRVLLLNPDATIDGRSVALLEDVVAREPLTLAAPVVRRPDGSVWTAGNRLDLTTGRMLPPSSESTSEMAWLSGACLLATAELWQRIGGFDDAYFLYWEDVDLSARVTAAGGTLRVVPEAVAIHEVGGTQVTTGRARSPLYYYFNIRNRQLFAERHLSPPLRRRWSRTALPAAREIVLRGGRRQLLRPWPVLRITWRALSDARRRRWGRGPF